MPALRMAIAITRRAPAPGVLELLEDEHAGPLADDEAVAILVEGTAGARRLVVARGQRPQLAEAADAHRTDGRLAAAGNHRVGVAALDDLVGVADGVRRGRAGRAGRRVGPFRAEADRHLARREIDDGRRNEEGRPPARTAVEERLVLPLDRDEPADTRADVHAD